MTLSFFGLRLIKLTFRLHYGCLSRIFYLDFSRNEFFLDESTSNWDYIFVNFYYSKFFIPVHIIKFERTVEILSRDKIVPNPPPPTTKNCET